MTAPPGSGDGGPPSGSPPAGAADPGPGPIRLGEPVELPWWVVPLGLPPLLALLGGLALRAPLSGRLLDLAASAGMLAVVIAVARRVRSRNLQSVWISAAYGFWLFAVLVWGVEVAGRGTP
jgi:hypothetical protein